MLCLDIPCKSNVLGWVATECVLQVFRGHVVCYRTVRAWAHVTALDEWRIRRTSRWEWSCSWIVKIALLGRVTSNSVIVAVTIIQGWCENEEQYWLGIQLWVYLHRLKWTPGIKTYVMKVTSTHVWNMFYRIRLITNMIRSLLRSSSGWLCKGTKNTVNCQIVQGESLARGPKLLSLCTVEQRGFLVRKYWQTCSFKAYQTAFRTEFGERSAQSKCCIQILVKKLEIRGSRSNACRLLSLGLKQPATRIPLQSNHTETPTHIEPRTIRPMW